MLLGRHAYNVYVNETYNITTCNGQNQLEISPLIEGPAVLLTSYEHCGPCTVLEVNPSTEVLVAGIHETKSDGVYFFLTCDMSKPLVSVWKDKYNNKIVNWVEKGNPTDC